MALYPWDFPAHPLFRDGDYVQLEPGRQARPTPLRIHASRVEKVIGTAKRDGERSDGRGSWDECQGGPTG